MKLLVHSALAISGLAILLCVTARPASGNTVCADTELSNILSTTCDIGALRFTFTKFNGTQIISNGLTTLLLTPAQFEFTPLPSNDGFTLTFGEPITAASTATIAGGGAFTLHFSVTSIAGGNIPIPVMHVPGLSVSPQARVSTYALGTTEIFGLGCATFCEESSLVGPTDMPTSARQGDPFSSGGGDLSLILQATGGDTVSWDPTMTVTFSTPSTNLPEPPSVFRVFAGLIVIAELRSKARFKWFRRNC